MALHSAWRVLPLICRLLAQVVEGEASHEALTAAREKLESLTLSHPNVAEMLDIGTRHMPAVRLKACSSASRHLRPCLAACASCSRKPIHSCEHVSSTLRSPTLRNLPCFLKRPVLIWLGLLSWLAEVHWPYQRRPGIKLAICLSGKDASRQQRRPHLGPHADLDRPGAGSPGLAAGLTRRYQQAWMPTVSTGHKAQNLHASKSLPISCAAKACSWAVSHINGVKWSPDIYCFLFQFSWQSTVAASALGKAPSSAVAPT